MNILERLILLGERILKTFGSIMDFMSTEALKVQYFSEGTLVTEYYTLMDLMIGAGLPILIIVVGLKWTIDIFT